ncbi:MAG: hypothetical protein KIT16_06080 [Rhodospirillaceae bacterium]|nr:hypothetical protein [Rhodospirillaceae bacterium]
MVLVRSFGALAFVLGVALLVLDAARSIKIHRFDATSLEDLWTTVGGDAVFRLRLHLMDWLGPAAERVLDLPAAFIAFGLGLCLIFLADRARPKPAQKPLLY